MRRYTITVRLYCDDPPSQQVLDHLYNAVGDYDVHGVAGGPLYLTVEHDHDEGPHRILDAQARVVEAINTSRVVRAERVDWLN